MADDYLLNKVSDQIAILKINVSVEYKIVVGRLYVWYVFRFFVMDVRLLMMDFFTRLTTLVEEVHKTQTEVVWTHNKDPHIEAIFNGRKSKDR